MFRTLGITIVIVMGITLAGFSSFYSGPAPSKRTSTRELKIQKEVLLQIRTFQDYVRDTLLHEAANPVVDEKRLQHAFLQSRLLFKQYEWAAEYFVANLTKRINGPPVQEIENADLLDSTLAYATDPMGLQVIEALIFPHYDPAKKRELVHEVNVLIGNTGYLIPWFTNNKLTDWRILDAAKLEVFRIISLGIAGFDSQLTLTGVSESAAALQSLATVLSEYSRGKQRSLLRYIDEGVFYLQNNPDFNHFDRAHFIVQYANKISDGIAQLERKLPGRRIKYNRMLRQEAHTLFDAGAFNVDAFSPGPGFHLTKDRALLGEKLFSDRAVSGTGARSCASCHKSELAFTDGVALNTNIHDSTVPLQRNTPTLLNAALQSNYFHDMRALTLEDQAADVIANPNEMDGDIQKVIKYLSADHTYKRLFAKAFPQSEHNGITRDEITNALASYTRSLTKLNSRFDDYFRGDKNALSSEELKGFNLFMGKAKCATCHFVPLFSGIEPPKYVRSEAEVLGVPRSLSDSTLDPDVGYYDVIGIDSYKYAFKTPTLRNVDRTAPYMHNGVYQTLEQVMEFYNNGGGAGLGIDLPNQTLSTQRLNLTQEEVSAVIAFMKSLNSQ